MGLIRTRVLLRMLVLETASEQFWFDRMSRSDQQRYVRAHPGTHFRVGAPSAPHKPAARPRQKAEMRSGDRAAPRAPRSNGVRSESKDFRARDVAYRDRYGTNKPVTKDAVNAWNGTFKKTPSQYHHALLKDTGLVPSSHVNTSALGVSVRTMGHDPSAPEKGKILDATRKFKRDRDGKLHVEHDIFEMHGDHQGRGVAKHFLRNSMREYRDMGVHAVHTHANLDVGGYAWAKYGFVPRDEDQWHGLRRHLGERFNRVKHQVPASTRKHVEKLLSSDDPRSVWHLGDLQEQVRDAPHDDFRLGKTTNMPLGKQLLLGSDWRAHLPLKDGDAMRRFHNYVGK